MDLTYAGIMELVNSTTASELQFDAQQRDIKIMDIVKDLMTTLMLDL